MVVLQRWFVQAYMWQASHRPDWTGVPTAKGTQYGIIISPFQVIGRHGFVHLDR
jgi:hypothetical protein